MQAFRGILWSVKESLFQSHPQTEPKLRWIDQSHMNLSLHHHHIFTSSTTASFILRHGQSHAAYWPKMFAVKKRGPDEAGKAIESLSLCSLMHLTSPCFNLTRHGQDIICMSACNKTVYKAKRQTWLSGSFHLNKAF